MPQSTAGIGGIGILAARHERLPSMPDCRVVLVARKAPATNKNGGVMNATAPTAALDIEDAFVLDVRIIEERPADMGPTACATDNGCAATCASACASAP